MSDPIHTLEADHDGAARSSWLEAVANPRLSRNPWARRVRKYVVPVVAVLLAVAIRKSIEPLVGDDLPFLLLLGAVMGSAFVGGTVGGLVALSLSVVSSAWLMAPYGTLTVGDATRRLQLVSFMLEGLFITLLCAALTRSRLRAEAHAEEARGLQREVSDAADREQRRIGQDLHDDLGQYLTGIALAGELLARRMEKEGSGYTEPLRGFVHMVNDAVNRTRQLARGLSPMAVDPDSLPLLLSELQERSAEVSGKRVEFTMTGLTPNLPPGSVLHLYRIAQEAVSNALKHSGGDAIDIELECALDRLTLSVTDNGRGVDPKAVRGRGMGLRVMQFRARTIDATLEVTPRGDVAGTRVVCSLAITPDSL